MKKLLIKSNRKNMKNKSIGDDYKLKNPHVNLFYRAMRITTFLLFFCSFCALADNVNSQTAKVTIKRSNVTLLDVLNEIENKLIICLFIPTTLM